MTDMKHSVNNALTSMLGNAELASSRARPAFQAIPRADQDHSQHGPAHQRNHAAILIASQRDADAENASQAETARRRDPPLPAPLSSATPAVSASYYRSYIKPAHSRHLPPKLAADVHLFSSENCSENSAVLKKVLIVDDSPAQVQLMQGLLEPEGYHPVGLNDPKRVEETITAERPSVILLDVVMPERNGFQICRELKSNAKFNAIPVILVTSKDTAERPLLGRATRRRRLRDQAFHARRITARSAAVRMMRAEMASITAAMADDYVACSKISISHRWPPTQTPPICSKLSVRSKRPPPNRSTASFAAAANASASRCWTSKKFWTGRC